MPQTIDLMTRLLPRIEINPSTGCWEWQGPLNRQGYGSLSAHRKKAAVHRVAYEHLVGPIASGMVIDHLCRVRDCTNPDHLEPVTPAENVRRGLLCAKSGVAGLRLPSEVLVHEYMSGASLESLASKYGLARDTIKYRLKAAGVVIRGRGRPRTVGR
jgi:uncharacterized protein (DUF433 family)